MIYSIVYNYVWYMLYMIYDESYCQFSVGKIQLNMNDDMRRLINYDDHCRFNYIFSRCCGKKRNLKGRPMFFPMLGWKKTLQSKLRYMVIIDYTYNWNIKICGCPTVLLSNVPSSKPYTPRQSNIAMEKSWSIDHVHYGKSPFITDIPASHVWLPEGTRWYPLCYI